jgi:hypothetical protein
MTLTFDGLLLPDFDSLDTDPGDLQREFLRHTGNMKRYFIAGHVADLVCITF